MTGEQQFRAAIEALGGSDLAIVNHPGAWTAEYRMKDGLHRRAFVRMTFAQAARALA